MQPKHPDAFSRPMKSTVAIVLLFLCLGAAADYLLNRLLARQYRIDQEVFVTLELGAVRARLEERLNSSLFLLHGMAANISVRPGMTAEEFDELARALMAKSSSLKNIAAAPDFVIRFIHPLAGNEKALGLDYRNVPAQWEQAREAKFTRRMAIAGPLDLVQGGRGIIARVPVFTADGNEFWGLVSSVMDLDTLLGQGGIAEVQERLDIAIRGKDSKGEFGDVFWGASSLFEGKAVTMPVMLPSGSWQLAAIPKNGWAESSPYSWMVHASVALITLMACLARIQGNRSRRALTENENRMRAMSEASHDALAVIDASDTVTFWNPSAEAMFGYSEAEMLGRKLHDVILPKSEVHKAKEGLEHFARTGKGPVMGCVMEMEGVRKNGEQFPVERSVSAFQFRGKWYAVGSMRDISARKAYEKRLNELATTDELTGLSNRRHFLERAEAQLRQAIRYDQGFSFMMFDLDHFKRINDTYGHDVGDAVLRAVAETLRGVMRGTDIFGRLGGEEFAVAMPETRLEAALQVAERLRLGIMEMEVRSQDKPVLVTVSIGLAHLDSPQTSLSELMKRADTALYEAKRTGRNRVVIQG